MVIRTKGNQMKLKIIHDDCPSSPRERDNLGTMLCNHSMYGLGDLSSPEAGNHGSYEADFSHYLKSKGLSLSDVIYTPIYMYEHSGISLSPTPFNCRWDSGQLGWHFVTKAKVREGFKAKRISSKLEAKVIDILNAELEEYNHYVQGNCYGFILEDDNGNHIDSCYGFIGDFADVIDQIKDHLPEEALPLLDGLDYTDIIYN